MSSPEVVLPEFVFYDSQCRRRAVDNFGTGRQFLEETQDDVVQTIGKLDTVKLPKPAWLLESELSVRRFFGSLGLDNSAELVLMADDEPLLQEYALGDKIIAGTTHTPHRILVKHDAIHNIRRDNGDECVGLIIAHEFGHASAPVPAVVGLQECEDDTSVLYLREGFQVMGKEKTRNAFLEEGFAHYMGGWYRRIQMGDWQRVIGIGSSPTPEVPHYLDAGTKSKMVGRDGYAMELLAWGAERMGVMTANDFVAALLESRSADTRLTALRSITRVINTIRPGLYGELSKVEFTPSDWDRGFTMVYEAVTYTSS